MRSIKELINLQNRTAMITGANGSIGKQIVKTIAELGGSLILVDKPGTDYSELKIDKDISKVSSIEYIECDLEDEQSRVNLINKIIENRSELSILINNAAFVGDSDLKGWTTDFSNQSGKTWRRALEVNLTAAFDLSKGLLPLLKKNNNGSIINIASTYGVVGPDYSLYEGTEMGNPAAYAASKGGLIQLTRWLSTTVAPDVRVNTISPGGVFRHQPEQFVSRYKKRTPLARMATEEDFKGAIAYLASDLSEYVTGQNILVDGGWTAW
jgi:NAD(P)-dependent dehydrogenase (short-subunit alcohol dehydrogenase family)